MRATSAQIQPTGPTLLTSTLSRGGVQNAGDKVFIQQGAGTTYITISSPRMFLNCGDLVETALLSSKTSIVLTDSTVKGPVLTVVGVNDDQGDTFSLNGLNLCDYKTIKYVCQAYKSNTNYIQPLAPTTVNIQMKSLRLARHLMEPVAKIQMPR
uniref:pectate lyase n=1 Tax=Ditylenchus dipsaci TaxID=166011 RepID=A0A915CN08_9BILA